MDDADSVTSVAWSPSPTVQRRAERLAGARRRRTDLAARRRAVCGRQHAERRR